jgi:hypothetical protein
LFRYNFGKHTYDNNLQFITGLPELERERVDQWINNLKILAKQSDGQYEEFNEKLFRPLIGIDIVRNFIQDMWIRVGIRKKMFMSHWKPTFFFFF